MRRATLRERLLSKAVINWETGCWEWTAHRDRDGYGKITVARNSRLAHRITFELIEGQIPAGLHIDHLCRNRACINPAHLEPVTLAENTRRGMAPAAIALRTNRCGQGHEFTPENTYAWRNQRHCRACNRAAAKRAKQKAKTLATDISEAGR